MKIYKLTEYHKIPVTNSPHGEEEEDQLTTEYDDLGKAKIVKSNVKKQTNAHIQKQAVGISIAEKISRYMRGDLDALNKTEGAYADLTDMPKNIHESMKAIRRAEDIFDGLPRQAKLEFGNDVYEFLERVNDGKAQQILEGFTIKKKEEINYVTEQPKQIRSDAADQRKAE